MAVRYSTHIGYGYYITNQEYFSITNKQGFLNSEYTVPMNKFDPVITDYFFGIKMASIMPGHGFCFPSSWNLNEEEIEEMKNTFKSFYPNRASYKCNDYVFTEYEEE